ncbi:MAG: acyclic terpene utilization AtuA family protein [Alphaproteobacteria bacterium]|nr:acyclic terpene utilization AtuA family protein [Alphaproteobacteria bacterium]
MKHVERLKSDLIAGGKRAPMRILSASGQIGYGLPLDSLAQGFARKPHLVGADMGSVDPGPAYLGTGTMGPSLTGAKADLGRVLEGSRALDIPMIVGSAGTGGAKPQLDSTAAMIRELAREKGLHFRLATIAADMPKSMVSDAVRRGRVRPIGGMTPLTEADVASADVIVGQMGSEAFQRALAAGADVIIAGRACDTAIYAALPGMLGYPMGPTMHMAKIVECASLCCVPGGRDAMLGTLEDEGFVLESMNPERRATPMSVAAHSLYEQDNPYEVFEPDGVLRVNDANYVAVDARRTRVSGATWTPARQHTVKIEGATRLGERCVLLCATADPRVIEGLDTIVPAVDRNVRSMLPPEAVDYTVHVRRYGIDGVIDWPTPPTVMPREVFLLLEFVAPTMAMAKTACTMTKQYLLHHGFPGRLSTSGNLAFPFTPPEVEAGTAFRFSIYHIMDVAALAPLFPVTVEDL